MENKTERKTRKMVLKRKRESLCIKNRCPKCELYEYKK